MLGNLTLAQRVGQLFLVGVDGNIAGPELTAAERTYHFGSLLLNKTAAGTAALAAQTAAMQELAPSGTGGVRLFIAANQEGGQIQQLTGPGFATMPSALEQGTWALSTLRAAATDWGTDLRAAGVNLDLAPVMDVVPQGSAASNAPIGALDREFGFDPVTNGEHGTAFIQGMAAAGVMTVAKHFPGLGRVAGNTDFTSNVVDNVTTANDPYLNSFRTAIGAGVPMVMVALATYTKIDPTELAVFSPTVMRLLQERARLQRGHRLRRHGRGGRGAGDPGGDAGDRLPHRGRRPHHLAEPRARPSRWRPRCSPRRRGTPPSAPRWTPPRSGCSPPSRRPGCCRADLTALCYGRGCARDDVRYGAALRRVAA